MLFISHYVYRKIEIKKEIYYLNLIFFVYLYNILFVFFAMLNILWKHKEEIIKSFE